jgi:hypothetical protein
MQMLVAGGVPWLADEARPPDVDNPRGYYELEAIKRLPDDAGWIDRAHGRAVKIVVPIVRALPPRVRCRVLLVRRAMSEVMASQRSMVARRGEAPLARNAEVALAAAFAHELVETERWIATHAAGRACVLDHGRILAEPYESAQTVAGWIGLPGLDVDGMAAVVDAALHRQRG